MNAVQCGPVGNILLYLMQIAGNLLHFDQCILMTRTYIHACTYLFICVCAGGCMWLYVLLCEGNPSVVECT